MQRRELESRLALYGDLSGILGAMRSFAMAELRKVTRREAAQQSVVGCLSGALSDLCEALSPVNPPAGDVWLLFGSARGFCGSFNEDVIGAWRRSGAGLLPAVVVGAHLQSLMPHDVPVAPARGALGELDSPATIDGILTALSAARDRVTGETGVMACYRDEDGARTRRLLPLAVPVRTASAYAPLTNEPAAQVAAGVAEHYLFHSLLALLLRSVKVENQMRLMQMENALRHLDDGRDELMRQRNRLRQEEIVEEIELMASGRNV